MIMVAMSYFCRQNMSQISLKIVVNCSHPSEILALGTKNRSRANCVPIYGDLYQNLQWILIFNLKVVTHLKTTSEASYDVINMATIIRNCPLIKAI